MAAANIGWIFDGLPASGARRGGNAAEHAFDHALGTFVREVCQNANDQAHGQPQIHFRLLEFEGDALLELRKTLRWNELEAHLRGAAQTPTRSGRRVAACLTDLDASGRLLALVIEDRGTHGLTGDEDGEGSHFRALCKDTLFSVKREESAGGSYGLGKSVLWAFSGLSTVVFCSSLSELPKGRHSPRMIARAELPYHEVDEVGFEGPGWFGREAELADGRRRAESVWGRQSQRLADSLQLARPVDVPGTSILVLGFGEPTAEAEAKRELLEAELAHAAGKWFWPAMQEDQRGLEIVVADARVRPESVAALAPFIDCWRRRAQAKPRLEQPGNIARVPVVVELPRPRMGGRKLRGQVDLLIRLADEDSSWTHRVACFRGAGMVVAYRDYSGMSGLRPFHAVLACGLARESAAPSEADRAIERFLRDAEPPGHDDWDATPAIKDGWQRGYRQVITRIWDQVHAALIGLLAPVVQAGVVGPERLRKRFALGRTGRPSDKGPSAFHFREFEAEFVEDEWRFRGTIEPELGGRSWRATISLHHLGEDGNAVASLPITDLAVEPEQVRHAVVEGRAEIEVPLGINSLALVGRSASPELELSTTEIGLRVSGELHEPELGAT